MANDAKIRLGIEVDASSLANMKRQIESKLSGINVKPLDSKNIAQANKELETLATSYDRGRKAAKTFFDTVEGKFVSFAAYTLASNTINKVTASIANATREAIKFEAELIKISQVVNQQTSAINNQSKALFDISKRYNVNITKVAQLTRILTQTGLSFREAAKGAEILAKTSLLATFEDLTSTTEGLIAVMQTFNLTVAEGGKVLEKINAVSKAFAVESSDIVEAIRRAGGAFGSAGGQIEELIALFTAVRSTTRESAETIATGFRTIFGRLQRPKTIEFFKQLNIELVNAEGNFVGPLEAIRRITEGLERAGIAAGSIQFAQVVEQIGGIRQLSRVVPLLEQYKKTQEALRIQDEASAESSKDVAKAQQGLGYQLGVLKQEFTELISEIVNSPSFKFLAETFIGITKTVISLTKALTPLLPLITAFATIKIGQGIGKLASGKLNLSGMTKGLGLGFASGGMVPGTGDRDTVPAMLTPGEFVIRKSAVKAFGADRLAKINKYKNGGPIKASAQEIGITDTDIKKEKKIPPQAIGGLRGLIWENDFAKEHGITLNQSGFPDVTNEAVAKKIGGKEAKKLELKYKPTPRTIRDYKAGLEKLKASETEIPMVVREFAEGGMAEKTKLTGNELAALTNYIRQGSKGVNKFLAGQPLSREEAVLTGVPGINGMSYPDRILLLDQLVRNQVPSTLYMGFRENRRALIEKGVDNLPEGLIGKIITLPGFLSTTTDRLIAEAFSADIGGVMKINTKPEGKGIDVLQTLKDAGEVIFSTAQTEKEFILPRGSSFKVQESSNANFGLNLGVQQLAKGGPVDYSRRTSKLVPQEKGMLSPSPFDVSQSKTDYYSLLDQYPELSKEFDSLAYFAKSADFNLQEFERYLQQRIQYKQQYANIRTDVSSLIDQLKIPERFANGGAVGTDTVPALLTPGEFVINKKSAQAFGYGNLKRINKYAKGGIVDGTQYFEEGGTVLSKEEKKAIREAYKSAQLGTTLSRGERTGNIDIAIAKERQRLIDWERSKLDYLYDEKIKTAIMERKSVTKLREEKYKATKAIQSDPSIDDEALKRIKEEIDAQRNVIIAQSESGGGQQRIDDIFAAKRRTEQGIDYTKRTEESVLTPGARMNEKVAAKFNKLYQEEVKLLQEYYQSKILATNGESEKIDELLSKYDLAINEVANTYRILAKKENQLFKEKEEATKESISRTRGQKRKASTTTEKDPDAVYFQGSKKTQPSPSALDEERKKAMKEAYRSQQAGSVLSRGERTGGIYKEIEAKYKKLFDEEKKMLREYYQKRLDEAIKQGKSTQEIIDKYRSELANVKRAMEVAGNAEIKEARNIIVKKLTKAAKPVEKELDNLDKNVNKFNMNIVEMLFYQQAFVRALSNFAGIGVNEDALTASQDKLAKFALIQDVLNKATEENVMKFAGNLKKASSAVGKLGERIGGKTGGLLGKLSGGIGTASSSLAKFAPKIATFAKALTPILNIVAAVEAIGGIVDAIFGIDYKKRKETAIEMGDVEGASDAAVGEFAQNMLRSIPVIGGFLSVLTPAISSFLEINSGMFALIRSTAELKASMVELDRQTKKNYKTLAAAQAADSDAAIKLALERQLDAIESFEKRIERQESLIRDNENIFSSLGKVLEMLGVEGAAGFGERISQGQERLGLPTIPSIAVEQMLMPQSIVDFIPGVNIINGIYRSADIMTEAYGAVSEALLEAGEKNAEFIEKGSQIYSDRILQYMKAGVSSEEAMAMAKEELGERSFERIYGPNVNNMEDLNRNYGASQNRLAVLDKQIEEKRQELQKASQKAAGASERGWLNLGMGLKPFYESQRASRQTEYDALEKERMEVESQANAQVALQMRQKQQAAFNNQLKIENEAMKERIKLSRELTAIFDKVNELLLDIDNAYNALQDARSGTMSDKAALRASGIDADLTTLQKSPEQILRGDQKTFDQMFGLVGRLGSRGNTDQLLAARQATLAIESIEQGLADEGVGGKFGGLSTLIKEAMAMQRQDFTDPGMKEEELKLAGGNIADEVEKMLADQGVEITPQIRAAVQQFGNDIANGMSEVEAGERLKKAVGESVSEVIESIQEADLRLIQAQKQYESAKISLVEQEYSLFKNVYDAERSYFQQRLELNQKVDNALTTEPVGPGRAGFLEERAAQRRDQAMDGLRQSEETAAGFIKNLRGMKDVVGSNAVAMAKLKGSIESQLMVLQDRIDIEQRYLDGLIEAAEAQRDYTQALYDAQGDLVRGLVTGTDEEAGDLLNTLNAATVAAQQGSFMGIPEDMKKQIFSVFDNFGDVVIPGLGITGRDAQREITKNEMMMRYGVDEATAQQLASKAVKDRVPIDERMKQMIELQEQKILELLEQERNLKLQLAQIDAQNNARFAEAVRDFGIYVQALKDQLKLNQKGDQNLAQAEQRRANPPPKPEPKPPIIGREEGGIIVGDEDDGGLANAPERRAAGRAAAANRERQRREAQEFMARERAAGRPVAADLDNTQPREEGWWGDLQEVVRGMGFARDSPVRPAQQRGPGGQSYFERAMESWGFAEGGIVYAANGGAMDMSNIGFKPKGTDTVPAMLTPGEFVVRRDAVKRGNNLEILESMNNGQVANYARGGSVSDPSGAFFGPWRTDGTDYRDPTTGMTLSEIREAMNNRKPATAEDMNSLLKKLGMFEGDNTKSISNVQLPPPLETGSIRSNRSSGPQNTVSETGGPVSMTVDGQQQFTLNIPQLGAVVNQGITGMVYETIGNYFSELAGDVRTANNFEDLASSMERGVTRTQNQSIQMG